MRKREKELQREREGERETVTFRKREIQRMNVWVYHRYLSYHACFKEV